SDWSGDLTPDQLQYAATDAAVLLPLTKALKGRLEEAGLTATAAREMSALPGIAWAGGVGFDPTAWLGLAVAAAAGRDRLAPRPRNRAPGTTDVNWNSPQQVKAALAAAGVLVESTADEVLAAIDHPLAKGVRDYRAAAKRAAAYGQRWVTE